MNTAQRWYARVTGLGFAAIFIAMFAAGGETPEKDAPAAEIIRYYNDHATALRVGAFVTVVAVVLLLMFGGALRQVLRAGPEDGWGGRLSTVAASGTAVYAVGLVMFAVSSLALVNAADLGDPTIARTLNVLDNSLFFLVMAGLATTLVATGIRTLQNGAIPRWLAWVSVVLGVLAPAGPLGFAAFFVFPFWVIAVAFLSTSGTTPEHAADRELVGITG